MKDQKDWKAKLESVNSFKLKDSEITVWKRTEQNIDGQNILASSLVCNENTCNTLFRSMAAK